jgi:hypothetical protein
MELGRSEVSNFIPRVHIAENGDSYLTSFGASSNFGLGTNLPLTKLDVVGFITTRSVLSCNGVNDAVQTDGTGMLVCGSVTGGGGGVTASGALTANALIIGGGASVVSALGSLGTTTTVLHGNAAGPPTFGAVSLTADVSGTLPGASGGTGVANSGKTLTLGATATSLPTAPGSTQCLHMDSGGNVTATGADCTGGGGTSGLSLISTLTATNTATNLAWTGLTGSRYMLVIENLVPATDGATLVAQFGQGGTPTYKTTGYQYNLTFFSITSVDSGTVRNNAATGFPIGAAVHNTNGIENCQINFTGLSAAVRHSVNFTAVSETSSAGNNTYNQYGGGVYTADTTAITAIRIITDGGNLASGSASLYLMN